MCANHGDVHFEHIEHVDRVVDHRLDLNDAGIVGGKQDGYYASVIWKPIDYVLFMLNYGHLNYEDAALATAGGDRSYGVDVLGVRAQIDF